MHWGRLLTDWPAGASSRSTCLGSTRTAWRTHSVAIAQHAQQAGAKGSRIQPENSGIAENASSFVSGSSFLDALLQRAWTVMNPCTLHLARCIPLLLVADTALPVHAIAVRSGAAASQPAGVQPTMPAAPAQPPALLPSKPRHPTFRPWPHATACTWRSASRGPSWAGASPGQRLATHRRTRHHT